MDARPLWGMLMVMFITAMLIMLLITGAVAGLTESEGMMGIQTVCVLVLVIGISVIYVTGG